MKCKSRKPDERGAIMLIAVFAAIFLVGLLYYLIGVGQALLFREKFQDAADAASLSSAVIHARGMNAIVFINLIMAAILSVLVTVKLLETLAIIGICIAAALAWCTFGASLSAIPPLNELRSTMQTFYDNLKDPVYSALEALHEASSALQQATPAAALALSKADIEATATPANTHGIVFNTRQAQDLPLEDDSFSELCGQAARVPAAIVGAALDPLGLGDVRGLLDSPMHDLASSLSEWFCGDGGGGGGSPAPYRQTLDRSYPRTQLAIDCESQSTGEQKVADINTANQTCANNQVEEDAAKPEEVTGNCQTGHDCTLGGPYDTHVGLAREQCDPTVAPAPYEYHYQARGAKVEYTWNSKTKTWDRGKPVYETPVYVTSGAPPCGPGETHPSVAEGYNRTVRKHDDVAEVRPVCSNEVAPSFLFPPKESPTTITFTEVLQILGCKRHETKIIDLSDASRVDTSGNGNNDKSPKKVLLRGDDGKSVSLGDDNFQLRALLHTEIPGGGAENVMKLALWNQTSPDDPLSALRNLRNFSVAQAEFFYDGAEARSEWTWNMKWKARFRRFRLPQGTAMSMIGEFCAEASGACDFLGQFKKLDGLFVH